MKNAQHRMSRFSPASRKRGVMNSEYAREYYGVPACIGRRVIAYGKPGIIAEDRGNYIGILLDKDKPGSVNNYHPIDGIEYLDEIGKVRKPGRSQQRYIEYLKEDGCGSFADFIGVDTHCRYVDGGYQFVNEYRRLTGPVCRLKKDAKVGFKAMLKEHREWERQINGALTDSTGCY